MPLAWLTRGALAAALLTFAFGGTLLDFYDAHRWLFERSPNGTFGEESDEGTVDPGRWSRVLYDPPPRLPSDREAEFSSDFDEARDSRGRMRMVRPPR